MTPSEHKEASEQYLEQAKDLFNTFGMQKRAGFYLEVAKVHALLAGVL